jgi:hypothetical protein
MTPDPRLDAVQRQIAAQVARLNDRDETIRSPGLKRFPSLTPRTHLVAIRATAQGDRFSVCGGSASVGQSFQG